MSSRQTKDQKNRNTREHFIKTNGTQTPPLLRSKRDPEFKEERKKKETQRTGACEGPSHFFDKRGGKRPRRKGGQGGELEKKDAKEVFSTYAPP